MKSAANCVALRGLAWVVLAIALAGCAKTASAPVDAQAQLWREPFQFIVYTDPQLGMISEDKNVTAEVALLNKAVAQINRSKPAFVVCCGDMVNKPGDEQQISQYLQTVGKIDRAIPLYHVSGNHDLTNTPTDTTIQNYRNHFGRDWYSFDTHGCHFVVLNTMLMRTPGLAAADEEQMAWLTKDLDSASARHARHIVVFQHHPPFVSKPDERTDYHNVPLPRRTALLDLYKKHNVEVVFAGHLHRCAQAQWQGIRIFAVGPAGQPLAKDPSGLCQVTVHEDRIDYQYQPITRSQPTTRKSTK